MNKPPRVAIVGGGVTGLSVAYQLEQDSPQFDQGLHIDLLESSPRLGGKLHSVQIDDLLMEMGAESFLSRKTAAIDLCKELGIEDRLRGTRPEKKKTFIWHREQMHRLPEGLTGFVPGNIKSLFSTSLLNLSGKLRVAADFLIPARKSDADESLESFMTRRLGTQAYRRLVQPLLCGIYAADGSELSLEATYPELRSLERKHGSLIRGLQRKYKTARNQSSHEKKLPPFVTFPGGMSDLIDALGNQLQSTNIRHNCQVRDVQRSGGQWNLTLDSDNSTNSQIAGITYDAIIIACPAYVAADIIDETSPELAFQLRRIPHVSTAAANLWFDASKLKHELDGYGFVVPSTEQNGVTAVTWTSSKHYDRCPENKKLIRAYLGRAGAEISGNESDEDLLETVRRELKRFMDIEVEPDGYRIQRWIKGSPQYTLSHPDVLEQIGRQLKETPNLFLTGASYRGVGVPDCIREGRNTAKQAISQLLNN